MSSRWSVPVICLAIGVADSASAQTLGGTQAPVVSAIRVVAALIVSVSAAFALALWFRSKTAAGMKPIRFSFASYFQRSSARIHVLEARRLGQYAEIALVRCDDVEYLILGGADAQQVLRKSHISERGDNGHDSGANG